jgi:hypothetical protein
MCSHQSTFLSLSLTHYVFLQLYSNCFVDLPACVLALTQLGFLDVRSLFGSVVVVADADTDSSVAQVESLVVSARGDRSNVGVDGASCENSMRRLLS